MGVKKEELRATDRCAKKKRSKLDELEGLRREEDEVRRWMKERERNWMMVGSKGPKQWESDAAGRGPITCGEAL